MKKLILFFALMLAGIGSAYALDPCQSGAYYNPETNGTGIDLQVGQDRIVLFRYGYLNGSSDYWVGTAANDDSGEWIFSVSQTFGSNGQSQGNVGGITLTEMGDGTLGFEWGYSLDLKKMGAGVAIPWCIGGQCTGAEIVEPLFLPHDCE